LAPGQKGLVHRLADSGSVAFTGNHLLKLVHEKDRAD
jgi:hypothetical protein